METKIEVKRLEAQLVSAQAQIDLAIRNLDRAKSLKETNSISQSQLEVNNTQLIKARSDYDNVLGALENARLSLSFTRIGYEAEERKLLIFRSYLRHMVEPCKNKTPRMSIAVNYS